MGKVIHVSDELHAELRKICNKEGVGLRELGERVLLKFIEEGKAIPPMPVPQRKPEPINVARRDGPSPYELPPFWQRDEQDGQEDQLEESSEEARGGPGGDEAPAPRIDTQVGGSNGARPCPSGEGGDQAA